MPDRTQDSAQIPSYGSHHPQAETGASGGAAASITSELLEDFQREI
jgi:hypothetical protein